MSGHWTDGLGLLLATAVIIAISLAAAYVEWRVRDRYRRLGRLVHRNLDRANGRNVFVLVTGYLSIEAGSGIKAGDGIEAGSGIKAGLSVEGWAS